MEKRAGATWLGTKEGWKRRGGTNKGRSVSDPVVIVASQKQTSPRQTRPPSTRLPNKTLPEPFHPPRSLLLSKQPRTPRGGSTPRGARSSRPPSSERRGRRREGEGRRGGGGEEERRGAGGVRMVCGPLNFEVGTFFFLGGFFGGVHGDGFYERLWIATAVTSVGKSRAAQVHWNEKAAGRP